MLNTTGGRPTTTMLSTNSHQKICAIIHSSEMKPQLHVFHSLVCISADGGIMKRGYKNALFYYESNVYNTYHSFLNSNRSNANTWNKYVESSIVNTWNKNKVTYLNPTIALLIDQLTKDFQYLIKMFKKILYVKNALEGVVFIPLLIGLFVPFIKSYQLHLDGLEKLKSIFHH